jgi:hypothetical protein
MWTERTRPWFRDEHGIRDTCDRLHGLVVERSLRKGKVVSSILTGGKEKGETN